MPWCTRRAPWVIRRACTLERNHRIKLLRCCASHCEWVGFDLLAIDTEKPSHFAGVRRENGARRAAADNLRGCRRRVERARVQNHRPGVAQFRQERLQQPCHRAPARYARTDDQRTGALRAVRNLVRRGTSDATVARCRQPEHQRFRQRYANGQSDRGGHTQADRPRTGAQRSSTTQQHGTGQRLGATDAHDHTTAPLIAFLVRRGQWPITQQRRGDRQR